MIDDKRPPWPTVTYLLHSRAHPVDASIASHPVADTNIFLGTPRRGGNNPTLVSHTLTFLIR